MATYQGDFLIIKVLNGNVSPLDEGYANAFLAPSIFLGSLVPEQASLVLQL